jgi:TM2 domain-containing membrane protein YozV
VVSIVVPNKKEPLLSLVLSLLFPGLGQIYNGQIKKGIILLVITAALIVLIIMTMWILIGFCFMIIPVVLWLYGIYDAYTEARNINKGKPSKDWLS